MNKVHLSLSALVLTVALMSGCSSNTVKSRSIDHYRNPNLLTQNRGPYRPLDVAPAPGTVQSKFSDVPSGEWYADHIQWSSNLGIIDGYPDGTFQPNKSMTRAEVIKVIRSLAEKGYITIPSGGTTTPAPGGTTTTTP